MSRVALILAGHGSHISPNTAGMVWGYVDKLRQWGVADEVTACFWKEEPAFNHVLDTVTAETIVIVPVFTAQGYFTQTVIPTEMRLDGAITRKDGRTIYYTPTMGEHPYLETIVRERVMKVISEQGFKQEDVSIAVIGHGTRRNKQSRDATRHQAKQLRDANLGAQVVDVYLDDDPYIPSIYTTTQSENIIALPYFLAEGSHVTIDLPDALGITYGDYPAQVNGRKLFYTPPVGTDDAICRLILELARDATGLPFEGRDNESVWQGFPRTGSEDVSNALNLQADWIFAQVHISNLRIQHVDESGETLAIQSPETLRSILRENPFRPLATSDDLPMGWHVDVINNDELYAVIETIYPALIADWSNARQGTFKTESLEDIGKRQVGMFQDIHLLDSAIIVETIDKVCGRCLRYPTWYDGTLRELPCKSPCNVWLSATKKEEQIA